MVDVQIIERDGRPEYAVVPYEEFERMKAALEDAQDVAEYDRGKSEMEGDESVPGTVVDRILDGESPLRVWREHRGLTLEQLADKADSSKSYLSQIEAGQKTGSIDLFRKLARALDVSLDELIGGGEDE